MIPKKQSAVRSLIVAAACALAVCAGAARAEPAATPATPAMTHERLHAVMEQRRAERVTAMLDRLAARLEIKATQESAWQGFSAALRDLMSPPEAEPHPAVDRDAAAMAREHADRAAAHAQKLARVADATAKLEQVLGGDQRLVLDEAARRFAHEHMAHAGMGHGGWDGHDSAHCDAHHDHEGMRLEHDHEHGHEHDHGYGHGGHAAASDDDDDDDPHGVMAH